MKAVYIVYKIYATFLTLLPERLMFFWSSFLGFCLHRVVRYRYRVVRENLLRSFPGSESLWLRRTERHFYRNLSDVFHEMIYCRNLGAQQYLRRVNFTNSDLLSGYAGAGRDIMVLAGHCANWELLGVTLPLTVPAKAFGAARRQSDTFFNGEINRLRSCMGLQIVPSEGIYRMLLRHRGERVMAYFLADQSPPRHENHFRMQFFNRPTAVFQGPELISRKLGMVVFFAGMVRRSRGRYDVTFHLLSDAPGQMAEGELTKRYMESLEETIRGAPSDWLWSHRRWKHDFSVSAEEKPAGSAIFADHKS